MLAVGVALAAEMLAGMDDQRVVLIKQRRIGREILLEELLNLLVRMSSVRQVVALQNPPCVRIDNKDGVPSGIKQNGIGCFRTDAVNSEKLLA